MAVARSRSKMQPVEKPAVELAYLLPLVELLICWTLLFVANPDLPRQISASLHPRPAVSGTVSEKERLQTPISAIRDWRASVTHVVWLINAPGCGRNWQLQRGRGLTVGSPVDSRTYLRGALYFGRWPQCRSGLVPGGGSIGFSIVTADPTRSDGWPAYWL
jgi:hypothetical protein